MGYFDFGGDYISSDKVKAKDKVQPSCIPPPEQIVLAAAAISLAITQGRTIRELESLINLLSLINDNVQAVLAERLICKKALEEIQLDVNI